MRVELGRRDHLRELLHVGRLNVHDVWHRESRSGPERGQNLGGWRGSGELAPHRAGAHQSAVSKQGGVTGPRPMSRGSPSGRRLHGNVGLPGPVQYFILLTGRAPITATCSCNCAKMCQAAQTSVSPSTTVFPKLIPFLLNNSIYWNLSADSCAISKIYDSVNPRLWDL